MRQRGQENVPFLSDFAMPLRVDSQMLEHHPETSRDLSLLKGSFPRSGHLNLDTFSPVNENGSFEFDRVLKSSKAFLRTKNKHVGQPFLRPVVRFTAIDSIGTVI